MNQELKPDPFCSKELKSQYRNFLEEKWRKNPHDIHYYLSGTASAIALEPCYTAAQRGKRIRALFQAWEDLRKEMLIN